MDIQEKAQEYFSSMNSIAKRICVDLEETKSSYETLWSTIPYEEQVELLNQSIMKPEITIKYPPSDNQDETSEYAVKMIVDDSCAYRDEHSGPFSFHTVSQRNLSAINKRVSPKKSYSSKVVNPAVLLHKKVIEADEEVENNLNVNDSDSLQHFIPKTGLDLLDNW